ncbi:MAG TPA: hypothetical protein VGC28_05860 [Sphingomonas sp.]
MTDLTIAPLPPAPLHAVEIWSDPRGVAARFEAALGFALPPMGRSGGRDGLTLIRYEPAVWLAEGDVAPLAAIIGGDGAVTAIGGGIARLRIAGPGWRTLLMEGGVFDAESATFEAGCSAATIIDHVNVRLVVESDTACLAYIPASYAAGLIHFWEQALPLLGLSP